MGQWKLYIPFHVIFFHYAQQIPFLDMMVSVENTVFPSSMVCGFLFHAVSNVAFILVIKKNFPTTSNLSFFFQPSLPNNWVCHAFHFTSEWRWIILRSLRSLLAGGWFLHLQPSFGLQHLLSSDVFKDAVFPRTIFILTEWNYHDQQHAFAYW